MAKEITADGNLVWSPVHKILEQRIKAGSEILLIIVPFAKLEALKQLDWVRARSVKLQLVCRWTVQDLISGASDLEIFTYLRQKGCELYINPSIHLKLYIFDDNVAFSTSGNLTLRGLGYSSEANIEVGNMVGLNASDWASIYNIIEKSRRVDEALYKRLGAYVESHPDVRQDDDPIDLFDAPKTYTASSLPGTETPQALAEYYFAPSHESYSSDAIRRAVHDLVTFGISPGLGDLDFDMQLGNAFKANPFVVDFLSFLRTHGNLRFGAVNDWIHRKCEDVPLPYRWELKEHTRIFYNWLAYYFSPKVTWNVPRHSQVIYWQSGK